MFSQRPVQPEPVQLKSGFQADRNDVKKVLLDLYKLMEMTEKGKGIEELFDRCHNATSKMSNAVKAICETLNLIQQDNTVSDLVKNVVLSAMTPVMEGDERKDIQLGHPVEEAAAASRLAHRL